MTKDLIKMLDEQLAKSCLDVEEFDRTDAIVNGRLDFPATAHFEREPEVHVAEPYGEISLGWVLAGMSIALLAGLVVGLVLSGFPSGHGRYVDSGVAPSRFMEGSPQAESNHEFEAAPKATFVRSERLHGRKVEPPADAVGRTVALPGPAGEMPLETSRLEKLLPSVPVAGAATELKSGNARVFYGDRFIGARSEVIPTYAWVERVVPDRVVPDAENGIK